MDWHKFQAHISQTAKEIADKAEEIEKNGGEFVVDDPYIRGVRTKTDAYGFIEAECHRLNGGSYFASAVYYAAIAGYEKRRKQ